MSLDNNNSAFSSVGLEHHPDKVNSEDTQKDCGEIRSSHGTNSEESEQAVGEGPRFESLRADVKTVRDTSTRVADILIGHSGLSDNMSLLEPSAGTGKIIDTLYENYNFKNLRVHCVELNREKYEVLQQKGYPVHNGDFLKMSISYLYDRIIACPPFKGNVDVYHIMKMYQHLERKGIMVSLTSPDWMTNNEQHHVAFRKFLEDKEYYVKMLPDFSYVEKYKTVNTAMIKIFKP